MAERQQVAIPIIEKFAQLFADVRLYEVERQMIAWGYPKATTVLGGNEAPNLQQMLTKKATHAAVQLATRDISSNLSPVVSLRENDGFTRMPALELREWVASGKKVLRLDPAMQQRVLSERDGPYTAESIIMPHASCYVELAHEMPVHWSQLSVGGATGFELVGIPLFTQALLITRLTFAQSQALVIRPLLSTITSAKLLDKAKIKKMQEHRKLLEQAEAGAIHEKLQKGLNAVLCCGAFFDYVIQPLTDAAIQKALDSEMVNPNHAPFVRIALNICRAIAQLDSGPPQEPYPFRIGKAENIFKVYPEDTIVLTCPQETLMASVDAEIQPKLTQTPSEPGAYHTYSYGLELTAHKPQWHLGAIGYLAELAARLRAEPRPQFIQTSLDTQIKLNQERDQQKTELQKKITETSEALALATDHLMEQINKPATELCRTQTEAAQGELFQIRETLKGLQDTLAELEGEPISTPSNETITDPVSTQAGAELIDETNALLQTHQINKALSNDISLAQSGRQLLPEDWKTTINNRKLARLLGSAQDGEAMRNFLRAMKMDFATAIESEIMSCRSAYYAKARELHSPTHVEGLTTTQIDNCLTMIRRVIIACSDANGFSLHKLKAYIDNVDAGIHKWNLQVLESNKQTRKGEVTAYHQP